MKENKSDKKLLIIIVSVLLVCVIGVSFAYYTSSISATGGGTSSNNSTSNLLEVSYDAGSSSLNATGLYPGKSTSKTFTVKVTPGTNENTIKYAVYLDINSNTFVKCTSSNYNSTTNPCVTNANELIYNLKDSSGSTIATGDLTGKTGQVTLATETKTANTTTTYTYTLEIVFSQTSGAQNHNANKSLKSNLKVKLVNS